MAMTWNPIDKGAGITLSNGNLTASGPPSGWQAVRSVLSKNSGKWYWEIKVDMTGANFFIGIGTSLETLTYPGDTTEGYGYSSSNGYKFHSSGSAYGDTFTTNDIISVALDLDNGKIWWAKNGIWQASGNPAAGTNPAYTSVSGDFFAMVGLYGTENEVTANFGATAFSHSVPSGFKSFGYSGYFSGYVYELGSPVQRTLFLHRRDNGVLADTITSSGNGYYYLETTYSGSHYVVCLDDSAGEDYNDLIIGDIYPTTISG